MSDWIEHDGTCCPVPVGTWVEDRAADGRQQTYMIDAEHLVPCSRGVRSCWFWSAVQPKNRIIAYRLPSSRAADELIERIRNLEPERELA